MSNQTDNTNSSKIQSSDSERMRDIVVRALQDAKGEQIKVLDVSKLTDITDFMIVSSGTSDRHVKSQSNRVLEFMHAEGFAHRGVEGEESRDWVLVDFVDVVVHVMREQTRKRYDLESLWDKTFGEMLPEGSADEIMGQTSKAP